MELSAQSLLALQRLARTVKKECQRPVSISRKGSISDLLKLAAQNNQNESIRRIYHEFISTLTDQQRTELGIRGVERIPEYTVETSHHDGRDKTIKYDRRQRNIHVKHDRRKKVVYRGFIMDHERRQQQLPFDGLERRGTGESSVEKVKLKKEASPDKHDTTTVKIYRGAVISDAEPAKKRSNKKGTTIYRGIPVDDKQ